MSAAAQLLKYLLALALMIPFYLAALLVGLFHRPGGWRIVRAYNRIFLAIFGVKIRLEKECTEEDLDRGAVLVGLTQQSLIDPTFGFAAMDRHYQAIWNIEYALIPVFGWVAWVLGWIIVRQNPQQAQAQLEKAARYAAEGGLTYLSIEGRRSEDGSLSPYKKGPAVLAIQAQTQIIPLFIAGSRACMPYGSWKIAPGEITLRLLKPIPVRGLTYDDRDAIVGRLHELAEGELARYSARPPRNGLAAAPEGASR